MIKQYLSLILFILCSSVMVQGQVSPAPGSATWCPEEDVTYEITAPDCTCKWSTPTNGVFHSSTNVNSRAATVRWNNTPGIGVLKFTLSNCRNTTDNGAKEVSYVIRSISSDTPQNLHFVGGGPLNTCDFTPFNMSVDRMFIRNTGTNGVAQQEVDDYEWELSEPQNWDVVKLREFISLIPKTRCAGGTIRVRGIITNCLNTRYYSLFTATKSLRNSTSLTVTTGTGATSFNVVCGVHQPVTFNVTSLPCAVSYRWTFPSGWRTITGGISGAETSEPSITLIPPLTPAPPNIQVTGSVTAAANMPDNCQLTAKGVTIQYLDEDLARPVIGPTPAALCSGTTTQINVSPIDRAAAYTWYTVPLEEGFYTGDVQLNNAYGTATAPVVTIPPNVNVTAPVLENGKRFGVRLVVKAAGAPGCKGSPTAYKDLWVGPPNQAHQYLVFVQGARGENPVNLSAEGLYTFQIDPVDGATSYRWLLPTGFTWSNTLPSNGYVIRAWTPETPGMYTITCWPQGLCSEDGSGNQTLRVRIPGTGGPNDPNPIPCPRPPCNIGPLPARVGSDGLPDEGTVVEVPASSGIALYPNPASSQLTISLGEKPAGQYEVAIFNSLQQRVLTASSTEPVLELDTHHLTPGVYIVHITTGSKAVYKTLQVTH